MDNSYQINLPTGMTPDHPDPYSTVIPSLAASAAHRVFVSGTNSNDTTRTIQKISLFEPSDQDIFQFNSYSKPKKEVNGTEMNTVQHCKSIQYNMKLSSGQKFFNNEVFIY
jgi:hypothetical protein